MIYSCVCLLAFCVIFTWHTDDFLEPRPPILSFFTLRSSRSSASVGMQMFGVDSDVMKASSWSGRLSEPVREEIRFVCVTSVVASSSTLGRSGFVSVTLRALVFIVFSRLLSFIKKLDTCLSLRSLFRLFVVVVLLNKKIIYFLQKCTKTSSNLTRPATWKMLSLLVFIPSSPSWRQLITQFIRGGWTGQKLKLSL